MRAGAIGILLVLACSAAGPEADSPWVEHEPMGVARSEHPAVVFGGEIVVIGGLVESGFGDYATTGSVEGYDPGLDEWRSMPDLPAPRHHVMAAVALDRLFVIGGMNGSGFEPVATVWELVDGAWVDRSLLPVPTGSGAAVTLDGQIYLVGGVPSGGLMRYDPEEDRWEELAPPQQAREHLAAVATESGIWAIAGRWAGHVLDTTEIYDPGSDAWRPGPRLDAARSGFGATLVGESIFVAGGEVFEPTEALSSVEVHELGARGWATSPALPNGLHGHPLVTVGSRVYLPGGSFQAAGVDNAGGMLSFVPG